MPWGFSQVDSKSSRHHISTSRCCRSAMRTLWARISRPHCDTPSTHDAFHEGVPPTRVYPIPSTHAPTDHCCFDGVACFHVFADVILAKELKRLTLMSFLSCVDGGAVLGSSAIVRSARCKPARNIQGVSTLDISASRIAPTWLSARARPIANPVGNHRALLQLEIERSSDELPGGASAARASLEIEEEPVFVFSAQTATGVVYCRAMRR
jgi:hypothetical protein